MWFNEVAKAPLPDYKKNWFRSSSFRRAISEAINREDLSRVVFRGHAQAAVGPVSPANKFWFNSKLKADAYAPDAALKALQSEGFRMENGALKDKGGNAVVFSILTNSGNKYRERMATMIQQDLEKIGIHVNVVTLDFSDRAHDDVRLRGHPAGADECGTLIPNEQMNVWLELIGKSPVESAGKDAGNGVGGGDRQAYAGAGFFGRCQEAQREFRPGAGNCARAGAVHLSGESECAVGGRRERAGRESRDSGAADLLERGSAFRDGEQNLQQ